MQLFYAAEAMLNSTILLSEEESSHLAVLRKKEGDTIHITDGNGILYAAVLTAIARKTATVHCTSILRQTASPSGGLHMVVAPTKSMDRMEWLVEKATEIGVRSFSFVYCKNAERKEIKIERLQKIIVSACKQSHTLLFPELHPMVKFDDFVKREREGVKMIAYCEEKSIFVSAVMAKNSANTILIGPEGDFTEAEVALAKQYGYYPVSLGEKRLRVETAGVYAASSFSVINNL